MAKKVTFVDDTNKDEDEEVKQEKETKKVLAKDPRGRKNKGLSLKDLVEQTDKKPSTTPWKPYKRLNIPSYLKDPRYVYRFVNTKKEGNQERKLAEGWEYDRQLTKKLAERNLLGVTRSVNDGTPLDSLYRVRELIVMRMPKEMAEARNKYYHDRSLVTAQTMESGMKVSTSKEGNGDADVYADSYGLTDFNKEERQIVQVGGNNG